MKYDDFVNAHLDESARKYAEGLHKAGLKPTPILTQAMAKRFVKSANEAYKKRYPWRYRLSNFPLIVSALGVLAGAEAAWFAIVRHQGTTFALIDALAALGFLVIAVIVWRKQA